MTTYQTDRTTLPATCSPHCNPVSHDLECRAPMPPWTPSKPRAEADWPGVGILRPRSDEDGEWASDRECDAAGDRHYAKGAPA